jgi:HAD superfamily hydrolase (TIGR01509 family)
MIKAILFDVDGCLINSFESNLDFFQKVMQHFGFSGPTREEYKGMFHLPTTEVVKRVTKLQDEKKVKEISEFALSESFPYESIQPELTKGAKEVLLQLSKKYRLGIVTSRTRRWVFESRDLEKLKDLFSVVITFEATKKHKPDPEPLVEAAKHLKVRPEECIYVGDAQSDKKAGNSAGMHVILYAKESLEQAALDTKSFSDIPKIIEDYE